MKKVFFVALLGFAPIFAATPCANMTVQAPWAGDMDVPANSTCTVQSGVTVTGNVTVEGELITFGGHFTGNVVVTGTLYAVPSLNNGQYTSPGTIIDGDLTIGSNGWLHFTGLPGNMVNQVKGNVTATNSGGPYFYLTDTTVGKNVIVSGATSDIVVADMQLANNGIFTANQGAIKLYYNTFGLNLNGSDNAQAPTGSNNIAKHKNGQFSNLP